MKTAESKISTPASQKKANKPFFGKGEDSFFGNPVQAKLNIGQPGDPYEKEADAVADKVVQRMAAPTIQAKCDCCSGDEEKMQKKEDIGEEEQDVQLKPIFESNGDNDIQTKGKGSDAANHSALEAQLSSTRNSGSPMAPDVQQNMESAFGTNFNSVRIHNNDSAAGMNNSLNAQAFTNGSNIYFNKNKYNPKSSDGQRLLAHELTHVVQQGAAKKSSPSVQKTSDTIQTFPQAGEVLPATEMQQRFYRYRNEVVELQGNSKFSPSKGLAGWISSMWQNGQDVAVNVKWGTLGSGFIWLDKRTDMEASKCLWSPIGTVCIESIPTTSMYDAKCQVMPINHPAFPQTDKGSVVMEICILAGNVFNRLGWVAGKKPDEIEPLLATGGTLQTDEVAFLPLIYGNDFTGENYEKGLYSNNYNSGFLAFASSGYLKLPNQQQIDGNLTLMGNTHSWLAQLKGAAQGLEKYEFKIERNPGRAEIYGEGVQFQLDKEWTGGDKDGEDGAWSATAQFRASYKNRVFEFFGKATYASARISGEVNLAIVPKTKAEAIFRQNAPGKKSTAGQGQADIGPAPDIDNSMEPLALTGYGNLSFKLVKKKTPAGQQGQGQGQQQGAGGFPDMDLEGTGAFAVSPDGYVVLAGSLKFPTNWKFTPPYDYQSTDADDKSKHLFQKKATVIEYPIPPAGTVEGEVGITFDLKTHINPLELYDIEVSGVYSNHPEFRSEVNITPKLYIDGFADATLTVEAAASAKALGLIKAAQITGSLTGVANFKAYISAAPTISAIWDKDKDGGKPAQYAIAGAAHAAGLLTFTLTGGLSVDILYKEVWSKKDFQLGSWTLANFGVLLQLQEYILGSDKKPQIDYSKIKFGAGQVRSIEDAIEGKKQKVKPEDPKGGFTQKENGKNVEKGTYSSTPIDRPDRNKDPLNNKLEQEFLMKDELHELSITFSGTRGQPNALIEMASGEKEPLKAKIAEEKLLIDGLELLTDDNTDKELEHRKRDLDSIAREADVVKKNAESAAEQTKEGEEPAVAGFDLLDDRLTTYANKYNTDDLGMDLSATPKPKPQKALKIPRSNGANGEMERRLMERRREAGYETFEHFKGVNVAVFQYHVLKPGRDVIDDQADGPFYVPAINVAKDYHTEVLITGELEKIHRSREFRKKYSPSHRIAVTQILTERSPCKSCRNFLRNNPSSLITTNLYHTYWLEIYEGNWIERNRNLMIRYGLEPPSWDELQQKYPGERMPDPH